ncbi:cAMP-binding domain of CRP or a regulatory subunit of cAMP-dependent protein kinases [Apibacter mensalis]|uniref:cAMP-binding domain of CRP or a regulatory subunit of cAMP-dependent protein kinases n=1 Tax=Apibacter mensalis TaxID=1586267 RepID=A0A0X3ANJ9_9FLAO|nr:Crp/Fnr family transcriptional regulator [Apibacter mensalis]CVK15960.1 cAMP-binding domain of CRP or a regulatory subunit of cAMP-dependent protein kinases [Apibacter mensalis]
MEKLIAAIPFYTILTEEEKMFLSQNCSIVDFDSREALFKQGSFAANIYFVLEGYCKMTYQSGNKKKIVYIAREGEIIGKDYILMEHYPYSTHSLTTSKLMVIPKNLFRKICELNNSFYLKISNKLELKLQETMEWLINLSFKNVEGAMAMFILKFCNKNFKDIGLSRTEIAEIIGYSRESIIHTLTKFEREKLIKTKGKNIIIKDIEKLKEIIKYG